MKLEDLAEIEVVLHDEQTPIEGTIDTGDPDQDRDLVRMVKLSHRYNPWAWCTVEVRASLGGITASEYLGCCSYHSEEDFRSDGYFIDMKREALDQLTRKLKAINSMIEGIEGI